MRYLKGSIGSALLLIIFGLVPGFGFAQNHESVRRLGVDVECGIERFYGYTLYQIGGTSVDLDGKSSSYGHSPISQLKFPIDVYMASLSLRFNIAEKFSLGFQVKNNDLNGALKFNSYSGKMKDTDWGYWYLDSERYPTNKYWALPNTIDIYSTSDAKLSALIINGDFLYQIVKTQRFSLRFGVGFLYQNLDFTISNLDQWYPSYPLYASNILATYGAGSSVYGLHIGQSGKVLTYQIKYYFPYLKMAASVNATERLCISPALEYSPLVRAKDRDDHLLRSKISKGESFGYSMTLSCRADYRFGSRLVIGATFSYTMIDTEGHQRQAGPYDENSPIIVPYGRIENKIESKQFLAGLSIGFYL